MKSPVPPSPQLRARVKARQLALLVALAEEKSLRQAAAAIAISQPAATKLLHDLEDTVGLPLFIRHAWGMEATLYGETMIRYARGMLTDLAEVRDELAALAAGARGKLRVGAVTGAVPSLLAPALAAVRRDAPGLATYVFVNANDELAAGVRLGTLDLAIGSLPPGEEATGFHLEALVDEPLCVVARAGHGIRQNRHALPLALTAATWVLPPVDNPLRRAVETLFANAGKALPVDLIETVSIVATLALLQQPDTFSVLPVDLAQHYESRGMLERVAVPLPPGGGSYALLTRANRVLSPPAQQFVVALRLIARQRASAPAAPMSRRQR